MRRAYSIRTTRLLWLPPPPLQLIPFTATTLLKFSKPLVQGGSLNLLKVLRPLTIATAAPFTASPTSSPAIHHKLFGPLFARCISSSSLNPAHTLEWNEPVSSSEVVGEVDINEIEKDSRPSIPVRAFFFSTSVDLKSLVEQNKPNFIPPTSRMTNYILLKFGNLSYNSESDGCLSGSGCCYMVVFQYGSIVLFNVPEHEVDGYLKIVEAHSSGLLPEMRKDEYEVREKPTLNTWMQVGLDYIMLQYLNIDGIRTIGSVLGQSIALDYYVRQVDGMVAEFTDINRRMEKTGTFEMERKKLFQLVGKANSNLADIWEFLRDEFELTQRFASLDFKLKFVEHNIRFLQEILQNRKSDFLEWLIIVLIAAEILISVYDIFVRSAITKR
ncbi:hypothetical protein SAY86_027281 [Trapa natans]|uniref:DUF155 domain-containing protein n=1 Tax=Trapa natans TaxID=22666 RepID=A0AAN7KTJ8_TRANT|nr:hypothetical protein SAY86_027281 [Trapa natans]